ncbi:fumarylacetoacetate hydrolase family protein [Salibacteraceae bacterium]|nr:fumarylacetoacetate hydrolase family protein [Salibacteraceae bacterium]
MIKAEVITEVADRIWKASVEKNVCEPVRDVLGTEDIEAAYKAQQINTDRNTERGARIIGRKIGLTSFAVQKQLGVDQPDFGVLTDKMQVDEIAPVPMSVLMQPKAEAEIAFYLSKDIENENVDITELIASISYAAPAIEIVGSMVRDWDIRITDTIADNASASHFVIGENRVVIDGLDLEGCKMKMTRGGEVVSEGQGSACMDNPLNAVLWLAKTMIKYGSPLKAGDVLLSGALGPMVSVNPGDEFCAEIEGIGKVNVSFGK